MANIVINESFEVVMDEARRIELAPVKETEETKTLTYKGNCSEYDSTQIIGGNGKYYRIVGASYDSERDCTTMELVRYSGPIFGSEVTVRNV